MHTMSTCCSTSAVVTAQSELRAHFREKMLFCFGLHFSTLRMINVKTDTTNSMSGVQTLPKPCTKMEHFGTIWILWATLKCHVFAWRDTVSQKTLERHASESETAMKCADSKPSRSIKFNAKHVYNSSQSTIANSSILELIYRNGILHTQATYTLYREIRVDYVPWLLSPTTVSRTLSSS